jgi:flagellar hook protein FlgE
MSFNTGLSGLNAARADLDVTANNIANANTTAFKRSTATFADVFSNTQGGSVDKAGNGVRLAQISQQFDQGMIEDSNSNLHLAVNGNGFFALQDETGTVYSRDGAFLLDEEGFLVNSAGLKVQAFPPVDTGDSNTTEVLFSNGVLADVQLDRNIGRPSATQNVNLGLNFRADIEPAPGGGADIDPADQASFDYTNTITVFDSIGNPHSVSIYAKRTGDNQYSAKAYLDGNALEFDVDGDPATAGNTNIIDLAFSADGSLESLTPEGGTPAVGTVQLMANARPVNGAEDLALTFDFAGSSMLGSSFSITSQSQDGFSTGRPTGLQIDSEGTITAGYTNGRVEVLGKIALATFGNQQGLQSVGSNGFVETPESGKAALGEAGTSTLGLIQSGGLETSNVDISQQLVRLITAQRNFQASSRVISTNDQITQTAINLGR